MKLSEETIQIQRGGNIIETAFGISEKDAAHILSILRSKLYSDKILAVVREYCANAYDAHVEANKKSIPIKVCLPTKLEPSFRVRDFGPGLTEDEVRNLYVMYGASTKRNSNESIGALGLGCKSGFAYSDTFNITSWKNGEKKIYCAYIDETKCGKIALLSTEKSNELDGIEVSIPVKQSDFSRFADTCASILRFFDPLPEISGVTFEKIDYLTSNSISTLSEDKAKIGIKYNVPIVRNRWSNSSSYIIMGGIPYKLNSNSISEVRIQNTSGEIDNVIHTSPLFSLGLEIFVSIGAIDVSASREDIEYTERTVKNLALIISDIYDDLVKLAEKKTSCANSLREAKEAYHQLTRETSWSRIFGGIKLSWKGREVDDSIIESGLGYTLFNRVGRGTRGKWWETNRIPINRDVKIYEADNDNWKKHLSHYLNYYDLSPDDIAVIRWTCDDAKKKEISDTWGLEDYTIVKTSSLKVPKTPRAVVSGTQVSDYVKTPTGSIFVLNATRNDRANSLNWTKVDELPDTVKCYVPIKYFAPLFDNRTLGFDELDRIINFAKTILHLSNEYTTIYGVKKEFPTTEPEKWVLFYDAVKEAIETSPIMEKISYTQLYDEHCSNLIIKYLTLSKDLSKDSPANNFFELVEELNKQKIDKGTYHSFIRMAGFFGVDIVETKIKSFSVAQRVAKKRYPLAAELGVFGEPTRFSHWELEKIFEENGKEVINYINMIDNQGAKNV